MRIEASLMKKCLDRFCEVMKTKPSNPVRQVGYCLYVLEFLTKAKLFEKGRPTPIARKLYLQLKEASDRLEAFFDFLRHYNLHFELTNVRGKCIIKTD